MGASSSLRSSTPPIRCRCGSLTWIFGWPPILDALQRELDMGVLGGGGTPESYREAVVYWQMRRFGFRVEPEWITQSPGVIGALNVAIQAFSQPGDYVLVQTPVYFHIHSDVVINGRRLFDAPLVEEDGRYRFDPAVFEAAIRPGTKLFILCNPHRKRMDARRTAHDGRDL